MFWGLNLVLSNFIVIPLRRADSDQQKDEDDDEQTASDLKVSSPKLTTSSVKPELWAILDGLRLVLSSTYLLHVSLFLWLSAIVSSFFYFQVKMLSWCTDKAWICLPCMLNTATKLWHAYSGVPFLLIIMIGTRYNI